MAKKSMFKKIVKIFGLVFLGAVVMVGGVVGFMAIRGDFKKKKIEPTEVGFEVGGVKVGLENVKLEYDVSASVDENIYSFTIKTLPEDATELECAIKVSERSLITFKTKKDGEWVDYTSNVFYLNRPIYFSLNNVTDDNKNSYNDGVITITVEAGYVKGEINVEIDRKVTSVSFVDQGIGQTSKENNKITNGLFGYEYVDDGQGGQKPMYGGLQTQRLEAVTNQPYKLQVVSAPLMADKPFYNKDAKEYEIYYVVSNQLKKLTHNGSNVSLLTYSDLGAETVEDCDFLTFQDGNYVLNTENSGEYEFKLAMYPTYAEQERLKGDSTLSVADRIRGMVTKTVVVKVSGTDAQKIEFAGTDTSYLLNLAADNQFVLNNPQAGIANLGLTLSKGESNTPITGRFDELQFLNTSNFINNFKWVLNKWTKTEAAEGGESEYIDTKEQVIINFSNNSSNKKQALVSGVGKDIDGKYFDAKLKANGDEYILELTYTNDETELSLSFTLVADALTGKLLRLKTDNNVATMRVNSTQDMYVSFANGGQMILGEAITDGGAASENLYDFKTLNSGLYLVFLGKTGGKVLNINSDFKITIDRNGADSRINIIPMNGGISHGSSPEWEIGLYGVVVNTDGSMEYTDDDNKIGITIQKVASAIEVTKTNLNVPIQISATELVYGAEIPVESLVRVSAGSYKGVLLFAPKFYKIELTEQPADWENSQYYVLNGSQYEKATEWAAGEYFRKNNYKFVEGICYSHNEVNYYLLGYVGVDGKFVNSVVVTGEVAESKLYAFVPQTKYLEDYNRNQTAEEYIDALLNSAEYSRVMAGTSTIEYDISLVSGKKVFDITNAFEQAPEQYSNWLQYYTKDSNENFIRATVPTAEQNDWANSREQYYISPKYINNVEFVKGATYYTLESTSCTVATISQEIKDAWETNKANYYIRVDYYIIKDVTNNDGQVVLTVNACSEGIEFATNDQFTFAQDEANRTQITNANPSWDLSKAVTVNCYYDFANSSVGLTTNFTGSYYDYAGNTSGGNHYIIADHKKVDTDWEGNSQGDNNKKISSQQAYTSLTIDCGDNNTILSQIKNNLQLKAYEYDKYSVLQKNNCPAIEFGYSYVGATESYDAKQTYYTKTENDVYRVANIPQSEKDDEWINNYSKYYTRISPISFEEAIYEPAANMYNAELTYYTEQDGKYQKTNISPEDKAEWATVYTNYYIQTSPSRLVAEFWANDSLDAGNYVKLVWIYTIGEVEYKVESGKLYIQSREVQGYNISLGTTAYQAKVINDATYSGKFYEFDGEKYTQVTGKTFALTEYVLETANSVDNWATEYRNYFEDAAGEHRLTSADGGYKKDTYYKLVTNKYYKLQDFVLETAESVEDWESVFSTYYSKSSEGVYQPVEKVDEVVPEYAPSVYYKLEYIKYTGDIQYKIVVGYDTDYTYKVYALDSDGNYLFTLASDTATAPQGEDDQPTTEPTDDPTGEPTPEPTVEEDFSAISTDINKAFTLGEWVRYEPFYASGTAITMNGNAFLEEVTEGENTSYKVKKTTTSQTGGKAVITLRNTSGVELKITVTIEQNGKFAFNDFAPSVSSSQKADIANGHFKYTDGAISATLDDQLEVGVKSITITKNGNDITTEYQAKVEAGTITYTCKKDEDDTVTIKYGENWEIVRSKFVNVELTLVFSCFLGSKECRVSLNNPYTITRSTTNVTDKVYSGTSFKIAKTSIDDADDTLYEFDAQTGSLVVYYYQNTTAEVADANYYLYNATTGDYVDKGTSVPADLGSGNYYVRTVVTGNIFTVPDVTEDVQIDFEIVYNYAEGGANEIVDNFALVATPNAVIMGDSDTTKNIDDYNTDYDISVLQTKRFKTGTYAKYEFDDANLENVTGDISMEFETYTDSAFTIKFSTNVLRYDSTDQKVKADIITKQGIYYVKGYVKVGDIVAGVIKFKVTSKSSISGENGAVESINITAKTAKTYTLAELQQIFNLSRNGEYAPATEFVAGETYEYIDGKYVLAETEKAGTTYYKKYSLADIFYINHTNPNLQITYQYADEAYTQKYIVRYDAHTGNFVEGNSYYYIKDGKYELADTKVVGVTYYTKTEYMVIVYNGTEYAYVGTTYNFDGLTYDLLSGTVNVDASKQFNVDNNVIKVDKGESYAYYCKQNALIFKSVDDKLLILSFDGNKKLYTDDASSTTDLTSLTGLALHYTAFGESIVQNEVKEVTSGLVGVIQYTITPVYEIADAKYCISTNDIYNIGVQAYTIQSSASQIVAGRAYSVSELFVIGEDEPVSNIALGAGQHYVILNSSVLTATENGNKNTIEIPVTATYTDGTKHIYNAYISVLNSTVAEISYPFNVEATSTLRSTFTTGIDELTNNLSGLPYDLTNLGEWLGYDTSIDDWESLAKIKFEPLLAGDKVNLSVADNNGLTRFATFQRATDTFNSSTTYYIYNSSAQKYEKATLSTQPTDWDSTYYTYFTKSSAQIGEIKLVAVSSTLASTAQNVSDNVICRNGTIIIGEDFNGTGYLAFEVHIKDSTAYGYYIVKVVDDVNFGNTIDSVNGRYSGTILKADADKLTGSTKIMDIIKNASTSISTLGRFDSSLIAVDYSNVYLFMLDNYDSANGEVKFAETSDGENDVIVPKYQLIPSDLYLRPTINAQTIKVAILINCNTTSLVYVGNYTIVIDTTLTITTTGVTRVNGDHSNEFELTLNGYDYTPSASNTCDLSTKITVEDEAGQVDLDTITLGSGSSANISIEGNSIRYNGTEFAQISGQQLVLTKGVSQTMKVCLELTYENGYVAYLYVNIKPIVLKSYSNTIELGNWSGSVFNTSLDLTTIFAGWADDNVLYYSTDNSTWTEYTTANDIITKDGNTISITSTTAEKFVYIKLELNNVVPMVTSNIYTIKCLPSISTNWNTADGAASRYTVAKTDELSRTGSRFAVTINKQDTMTSITITNGTTELFTTKVAAFKSVTFSLSGIENANRYFANISQNDITYPTDTNGKIIGLKIEPNAATGTYYIPFIHLPNDQSLTLTMTINDGTSSYTGIGVMITLPTTYAIYAGYRVSDYKQLSTKPSNWDTNYNDYYTKVGNEYIKNNQSSVPTFTDVYYERINASYETVKENTSLAIYTKLTEQPADWNYNYNNYYTKDGDNYIKNSAASAPTFEADKYYDFDIHKTFFGHTPNQGYIEVNTGRIYVVLNGVVREFNAVHEYIGLLDSSNLNYLTNATVNSTLATGGAIKNDNTIEFGNANDQVTFTMSNSLGADISYNFVVYTADTDLGSFEFADLLVVDDTYVPVSRYDLINPNDENSPNQNFILGYLKYYPTEDNNFAWIKTNRAITFKIAENVGGGANLGAVKLDTINIDTIGNEIEITIITVDGIAKQFTLRINNINVDYGYSGSREELYAGTEGYKLTDNAYKAIDDKPSNTSTGKARINVTNTTATVQTSEPTNWDEEYNNYYTYNSSTRRFVKNNFAEAPTFRVGIYYTLGTNALSSYTINYKGAVGGEKSYLPYNYNQFTYSADDESLVWYKSTGFGTRAVKDPMIITLVFDLEESGKVVTQLYYPIRIRNDIKIGMNGYDDSKTLDLYLGSAAYTKSGNNTKINLLQSRSDNNYNNIFVTLERYSTNNVIFDGSTYVGKALYNGSNNAADQTQSVYSPDNVSQYLKFNVDNLGSGLYKQNDKGQFVDNDGNPTTEENSKVKLVSVNNNGILTITGNPSGTFTLIVTSTNGTGYSKSFDIQVHSYYKITAKFNDSIANIGSKKSGDEVDLVNTSATINNQYAFNIQQSSNGSLVGEEVLSAGSDSVRSYEVLVSPINTSIDTIKNSSNWNNINSDTVSDGKYKIPAVPYSSTQGETAYYIVSVRMKIVYHNQSTYYYAHYKVYNNAFIEISDYYINNGKVVTYGDTNGCWPASGSDVAETLTLMDTTGKGMYNSLVPLTEDLGTDAAAWAKCYQYNYVKVSPTPTTFVTGKYFVYNEGTGNYALIASQAEFESYQATATKRDIYEISSSQKYKKVSTESGTPQFTAGQYFAVNDVVGKIADGKIEIYVIRAGKTEAEKRVVGVANDGVTLTLPDNLFANSGVVTIIFKDKDTNQELLRHEWTFKSNTEITPKSTKILSEFFLLSEINNQAYYDTPIVGIYTDASHINAGCMQSSNGGTVTVGSKSSKHSFTVNEQTYTIYSVTYKVDGSGSIFTTTYDAYVLVGSNKLMAINFNGGNYYINHTVDDNNDAKVNVVNYVTMWQMNSNGKFAEDASGSTSVTINATSDKAEISGDEVILKNVDTYTSGQSVSITITRSGISRTVDLYFNIIITAKSLNGNQMAHDSKVTGAKTADEIDSDTALKTALLEKIKFNGLSVSTTDYNKFSIKIEEAAEAYKIIYTYTDTTVAYTRTILMAKS